MSFIFGFRSLWIGLKLGNWRNMTLSEIRGLRRSLGLLHFRQFDFWFWNLVSLAMSRSKVGCLYSTQEFVLLNKLILEILWMWIQLKIEDTMISKPVLSMFLVHNEVINTKMKHNHNEYLNPIRSIALCLI